MPLDDVPIHQRRVTRRRLIWNTQTQPALPPLRVVLELYLDTALCQIPDPATATASAGVAPHLDPNAAEPIHAVNSGPTGRTHRRTRLVRAPTPGENDAGQRAQRLAKQ